MLSLRHRPLYLFYLAVWVLFAIKPKYFADWLLENVLVFLFFPLVIWLDNRYKLSFTAIALLMIFGLFHALGAHFTYAEMPYFQSVTAFFGFERNHYDRLVHFLFGLLLFRFFYEIATAHLGKPKAALLFVTSTMISISALYEILEWAAAMTFYPELGIAFLGTQGDVWDAQKDTLAAILGTLISMVITLYSSKKRAFDPPPTN